MDDTNHEFDQVTPKEEQLARALDALIEDKPLSKHRLSPELAMALRLKTSRKEPILRKNFDLMTEKVLLSEFGKTSSGKFWQAFWRPVFAGAFVGALMLAVISPLLIPDAAPQTIAEVQDFESLSEAETLLGALPVDAVTEGGLSVADLREEIHEINLLRETADLTLDPDAEVFPHVQLRDTALELIDKETELQESLPRDLLAMADAGVTIDEFSGKVSDWPTTNKGVDFETHEKAVTGYLTHGEAWNEVMAQFAQDLTKALE